MDDRAASSTVTGKSVIGRSFKLCFREGYSFMGNNRSKSRCLSKTCEIVRQIRHFSLLALVLSVQ